MRRRRNDDVCQNETSNSSNEICATQPLLVVGNGRAYTVSETASRKAIMSVVQKAAVQRSLEQVGAPAPGSSATVETPDDDNEEQIYWLRPAVVTPHHSPDSGAEDRLCWFSQRKQGSQHKHKVTFNEATSTSNIRNNKNGIIKTKLRGPGGNGGPDEDDGDYATLREIPIMLPPILPDDDTTSEEGKLLACVHDDNVTYASTSRDLIPPADYEDPSPLLTPEPLSDREEPGSSGKPAIINNPQISQVVAATPRCLRRADSGMPLRSDSISTDTESSQSPPDPPGSNHSETSSGVHSNGSSEHVVASVTSTRRATSVADLVQQKEEQWKSSSLQRNIQPPIYGTRAEPGGIPAVILENPETTVVIRRKTVKPSVIDSQQIPVITEEPFGRSTNMRMTSFTEHNQDLQKIQASSATLPHYPTQPIPSNVQYPHCSTMPLPHNQNSQNGQLGPGTSCNVYPRQHTTIPTHHNGVRLFPATAAAAPATSNGLVNPYVKRVQGYQNGVRHNGPSAEGVYGYSKGVGEMYYNS